MNEKDAKRFWSKVDKTSHCWNWKGTITSRRKGRCGYGCMIFPKVGNIYAHRLSYELFKGEIPIGKHIDHICKNTLCVNPKHLQAVSPRENIVRDCKKNNVKIVCRNGHILQFPFMSIIGDVSDVCASCKELQGTTWYFAKKSYPQVLHQK